MLRRGQPLCSPRPEELHLGAQVCSRPNTELEPKLRAFVPAQAAQCLVAALTGMPPWGENSPEQMQISSLGR